MGRLGPYSPTATKALAGYAGSVTDPTDGTLWETTKTAWANVSQFRI